MGNALIFSLLLIVGIFIGAVIAFIITALKKKNEEHKASNIIEKAKKDAEKSKRDALLEAKEESYKLKLETEYGKTFIIDFNDVVWVKTGNRFPKGVYEALKGKGAHRNVCRTEEKA